MKKLILLFIFTFCLSANAQKMFAGVFKGASGNELVTTTDKACAKPEGNTVITSGTKRMAGCWTADGAQIKVELFEGATRAYPMAEMLLVAENLASDKPASKPNKTHLTCAADAWSLEVDIERNEAGELKRFIVEGDEVLANERSTQITYTYDGLSFKLSSVTAGFTYEPSGVTNYIRKTIKKMGKPSGTGECKITEIVKKF